MGGTFLAVGADCAPDTVSTDDADVNGDVTRGPRVLGQVSEVLVDETTARKRERRWSSSTRSRTRSSRHQESGGGSGENGPAAAECKCAARWPGAGPIATSWNTLSKRWTTRSPICRQPGTSQQPAGRPEPAKATSTGRRVVSETAISQEDFDVLIERTESRERMSSRRCSNRRDPRQARPPAEPARGEDLAQVTARSGPELLRRAAGVGGVVAERGGVRSLSGLL